MKSKFAERFNEAMENKNLIMADISRITGINRSSLSEYAKGSYVPKQDRIYDIAKALNVSPAWLMGFNVPIQPKNKDLEKIDNIYEIGEPTPIPILGDIACGDPIWATQN